MNQPFFYELCNTFGLKFGWFPHLSAIHTYYPTLITYQPLLKLLSAFSAEMNSVYTKSTKSEDLLMSLLNSFSTYQNSGDHFEHLQPRPVLFSKQDQHTPSQPTSLTPLSFSTTNLHSKLLLKSGKLDIGSLTAFEAVNNFWVHRRLNLSVLRQYVLNELTHSKIPHKTNHMEYPFAADIVILKDNEFLHNVAIFVDDIDARIIGGEHVVRLEIDQAKTYFRAKKWKVLEITEQTLPKLLEVVDAAKK